MSDPSDKALMPCPFCGEPGAVIESRMAAWSAPIYAAGCEPCNMVFCEDTKAQSIAAWNRRTPARELDAEKGGEWLALNGDAASGGYTPPAQAAEAVTDAMVERLWLAENRDQIRAAIAAIQEAPK